MRSALDEKLTNQERSILNLCRSGDAQGIKRLTRLSIQYAIGAGIFSLFTALYSPHFVWVVYGTFTIWLLVRVIGARKIASNMPAIIEKYEHEIALLRKFN
jgi:hypothetical protein